MSTVVLVVLGLTGPVLLTTWIGVALVALIAIAVAIAAATGRGRRFLVRELGHLRRVFRSPRATLSIVAASVVVVAAHSATFIVACLAVGVDAAPGELIGLAVVALAAAALPLSIGGWGPREAASASAFALVGLGAGGGLAASTAFGVLTMIAVLPGLVVLIVEVATARRAVAPTVTVAERRTA